MMPGRHGHNHVSVRLLIFYTKGSLIFEHGKLLDPLNIFEIFFSAKILQPSAEGTEVSRALYLVLIICKSWFLEANLPKIDTKFDEKVRKS
jgi:hypothetical protein